MKNKNLFLFVMLTIFLTSCQTGENLSELTPHYHSKATKLNNNQVLYTLKVPDRIIEKRVYLKSVNPILEIRLAPSKKRQEFVIGELVFTSNSEEEMSSGEKENWTWDSDCNILKYKATSQKPLTNVRYASIVTKLPDGIEKKYISGDQGSQNKDCYSEFEVLTSKVYPTKSLIFFHPGHNPPPDPEFDKDATLIKGG